MGNEDEAEKIIAANSLDDYELVLLNGLTQTKGSKAVHEKCISEAINNVLSTEVEVSGKRLSVAEELVIKTVHDAIENPSTGKLKDLAGIIGDVAATKVEVATSKVDEELAKAALGESDDGAK